MFDSLGSGLPAGELNPRFNAIDKDKMNRLKTLKPHHWGGRCIISTGANRKLSVFQTNEFSLKTIKINYIARLDRQYYIYIVQQIAYLLKVFWRLK
jgi:hypothetical protein